MAGPASRSIAARDNGNVFAISGAGIAIGVAFFVVLAWAYAAPFTVLASLWWNEPDYSHGFLVPVFAGYLLWTRRDLLRSLTQSDARPEIWVVLVGFALIALACVMRFVGTYYYYPLMDVPSLVPCLAGLALIVGGWAVLRWAWPGICYLVFMLPLPGVLAVALSSPLQRVATVSSTWLLQLFGVPAVARGNVIWLTNGKIGVVEACSGLRMLMLFLAITVGASFLIRRPLWEKIFVALSALVIAVLTNILRITVTAFLHEYVGAELADKVFHDLAGWLMMPVATALLFLELYLLSKLLVDPQTVRPAVLTQRLGLGRR